MMSLTQLEAEIFALPLQQRAMLVQKLLLSLEELSNAEFETLWSEESIERVARFDSGQVSAVSGAEVAQKARALIQ